MYTGKQHPSAKRPLSHSLKIIPCASFASSYVNGENECCGLLFHEVVPFGISCFHTCT